MKFISEYEGNKNTMNTMNIDHSSIYEEIPVPYYLYISLRLPLVYPYYLIS